MDAATVTAIFAGIIALAGAFFAFIKWVVSKLTDSFDKNTEAMNNVAKATTKSAKEAATRNGHLAELSMENKKSNAEQNEAILKAISDLPTQHVTAQLVDKQIVKGK